MTAPAIAPPGFDQVLALPLLLEGVVTPDFIDENGHMNIRHYLDAGADGAERICRRVGIDDAYRAGRRMGVFTAEHHIRYLSEFHEGGRFSVHTRVLACSARVGHLMSFVLDRDQERLSCTVEIILVHVGLDTRRPEPFPGDVAAGLDQLVAASDALGWAAPVCGAMGIRT
jgi:acyl-CoA thioester hydrolase